MLDNFSTGKHPIIARHRNQVELIENGEITNFVDLGALALWVDAAPEHYTFYEVSVDFSAKLAPSTKVKPPQLSNSSTKSGR